MAKLSIARSAAVLILILSTALNSSAQSQPRMSIEELRQLELPDIVLVSLKPVTAESQRRPDARGYLEVQGLIGGTIRFELLLPDEWNQGFVMGGGGGFVGTVQNSARDSVHRGYATVGTDTGHEFQPGYMADWAYNNLEAQLNFGYLAVHRTAEAAKALIRAYYRADPKRSYFLGCSRGGGQAMMEAQRYPDDFDGIVAGAPAFDWPGIASAMVAIAQKLYPDPEHLDRNVLTKEALQTLHDAIIEQCDAQDGLRDGIIQDPSSVHFDLAKVSGLTDPQREAIRAIYRGSKRGDTTLYPGYPAGAECIPDQWIAWIVGPVPALLASSHVPDLSFAFGTQIFKGFVFNDPEWDYSHYDFSQFERDTKLAASFLNATNPDLEKLKASHGKLIIWHGWADPALPAQATVNYYRQVLAHDPDAADYCRLFMVPGCLHCGGGPGASEVDWLQVIVDWVEHDQAPDKLIATRHASGKAVLARPLFPYPSQAVYSGTGDPNAADSFIAKRKDAAGGTP